MKKFFLLVFLFSIVGCDKMREVSTHQKGVTSDSILESLARIDNMDISKAKRIEIGKKVYQILSNYSRNDSLYRKNILKLASSFYSLEQYVEFRDAAKLGLGAAEAAKDTLKIIKANTFLAQYSMDNDQSDSAFVYFTKAENLAKKVNDYESLVDVYFKKALLQSNVNDFSGSELNASKALNYLKYIENKDIAYYAYNLIGVSSNEMQNYDRALDYHNRALKIINQKKEGDIYHLGASSMNNIGVVYQNMNLHQKAKDFFREAMVDNKLEQEAPALYAILLDNLAYSKFKSDDFSNLPDLFFKSLKIRDSLGLSSGIVVNNIHLSEYYAAKKDTANSQKFAWNALSVAKKSRVSGDILGSLKQIFLIDGENATNYYKEYIRISDSIQQAERNIKERFDRIQFETDELTLEKDKLEEQNRNLFYFFIGTLMIGMLLFVIRMQRAKNRELLLKQAQQKANEDIYNLMISQQNTIEESRTREKKRIAQELHDGILGRLFGARLNLDSFNKQDTPEAVEKRYEYLAELKNIEQDIREISHDLNREKYVLINNFIAILNNLLEEQRISFEPNLKVAIDEEIKWELLENTAKINLYRIIQESLQNINKYARARNIKIEIKKSSENLILNISDDGEGFSLSSKKKGIGLQNMISRAHELNGTFDIRSKKGKGTNLTVTFAIENSYVG